MHILISATEGSQTLSPSPAKNERQQNSLTAAGSEDARSAGSLVRWNSAMSSDEANALEALTLNASSAEKTTSFMFFFVELVVKEKERWEQKQ